MAGDSRILSFLEDERREDGMQLMEEDFFGKGELAARLFAERRLDATAVVAFNDEFALGMCKAFHSMGLRVPEDISIIGIDGSSCQEVYGSAAHLGGPVPGKTGSEMRGYPAGYVGGKKSKVCVRLAGTAGKGRFGEKNQIVP